MGDASRDESDDSVASTLDRRIRRGMKASVSALLEELSTEVSRGGFVLKDDMGADIPPFIAPARPSRANLQGWRKTAFSLDS